MNPKYYTLDNHYDGVAEVGDWILNFPVWVLENTFNLKSPSLIGDQWNSQVFAFAKRAEGDHDNIPKPDFPIVLGEWQAASSRLRRILERICPGSFEFLPFRTRTSTGGDITADFSVMHYLVWLDAIDKKQSVLLPHETRFVRPKVIGSDYLLDKVILKSRKLTSPVCRILGWSPYHLYREDVVETLLGGGFTGLKFEVVETV